MKFYAGIGSTKTPPNIQNFMTTLGFLLDQNGWTLRSGGAPGADTAFEAALTDSYKEIFLPWKNFNGNKSEFFPPSEAAVELAKKFHPAWYRLSYGGKLLMARNCHQVLGANLESPVKFIVCWTQGGTIKGGTGQALRMAEHYNIPVYNLGKNDIMKQIVQGYPKIFEELVE